MPEVTTSHTRHAELVSAPISPHAASASWARWALKQVQGDERKLWRKGFLLLPAIVIALSGCGAKSDWKGWVYPDRNNLTDDIPIGAYSTLEDCRASARNILTRLKTSPANQTIVGDYECGLKCKPDSGLGGINVCEKTER